MSLAEDQSQAGQSSSLWKLDINNNLQSITLSLPYPINCVTILLYYCNTILLYYCNTVLLYYCNTVLLYYCITVLLYYCVTVLLYYCNTVLLYYCITVWLYGCIAVLLYYCITVLLYYRYACTQNLYNFRLTWRNRRHFNHGFPIKAKSNGNTGRYCQMCFSLSRLFQTVIQSQEDVEWSM